MLEETDYLLVAEVIIMVKTSQKDMNFGGQDVPDEFVEEWNK